MEYINVFAAGSKAYQHLSTRPTPPIRPIPPAPASSSGFTPAPTGLSTGIIVVIVLVILVELGLTIWGIAALVKFWKFLPSFAAVLSLVLLVFGFAPFSLIVTYLAKRV